MSVHILTSGYWPTYPVLEAKLPVELTQYQTVFKDFYLSKHSGRRLVWHNSLGTCTVRAHFSKAAKELSVSLFQVQIIAAQRSQPAQTVGLSAVTTLKLLLWCIFVWFIQKVSHCATSTRPCGLMIVSLNLPCCYLCMPVENQHIALLRPRCKFMSDLSEVSGVVYACHENLPCSDVWRLLVCLQTKM